MFGQGNLGGLGTEARRGGSAGAGCQIAATALIGFTAGWTRAAQTRHRSEA